MRTDAAFPMLESILLIDGEFPLLRYHESRMKSSLYSYYGISADILLMDWISGFQLPAKGKHKCRLLYGKTISKPEFIPYESRPSRSLKVVKVKQLDYSLKYADRTALNRLFDQRGIADDVLIVQNNRITDTSYCNIAFYNGSDWLTPDQPLLKGVRRQFLLDKGVIREALIHLEDLRGFTHFKCFNAMISWEDARPGELMQIIH